MIDYEQELVKGLASLKSGEKTEFSIGNVAVRIEGPKWCFRIDGDLIAEPIQPYVWKRVTTLTENQESNGGEVLATYQTALYETAFIVTNGEVHGPGRELLWKSE